MSDILPAGFYFFSLLLGALAAGLLIIPDDSVRPSFRALAGFPLFIIISGAAGIILYFSGVTTFITSRIIVVFSLIIYFTAWRRKKFKSLRTVKELAILSVFLAVGYFVMYFGWGETGDGTIRAISGSWGDGVLHVLNAKHFAVSGGGDFAMPSFAGEKYHEPFGYDFFAGLLLSLGFSYGAAFTFPAAALLASLLAWSGKSARDISGKKIAFFAAPVLVLLGSGLQWAVMATRTGSWNLGKFFGVHSPVWDKQEELGLIWANHINTFASQKHFLLAASVLSLLAYYLYYNKGGRRLLLVLAMVTAFLPFFHAHGFIAAALLWFVFWLRNPNKIVFLFGLLIVTVALPIFYSFGGAVRREGFLEITIGYMSQPGIISWIKFWAINLGLFLPLVILALLDKKDSQKWLLGGPALILFVLGNVIQFQPYLWDNHKIFLFAWFLILPLVILRICIIFDIIVARLSVPLFSYVPARSASSGTPPHSMSPGQNFLWKILPGLKAEKRDIASRAIVSLLMPTVFFVFVFLSLSLTTISEATTYFTFRRNYPLYNPEDRQRAEAMAKVLPANAVVLAATDVKHNHFITLTGRTLALGYGGWIWSRGMDLAGRQREIAAILNANGKTAACSGLNKLKISHVLYGAEEKMFWNIGANSFLKKSLAENNKEVYEVREICEI